MVRSITISQATVTCMYANLQNPHKSLFMYSYHMCYWFSPFLSCKHQCFLLPLIVWHLWLSLSDFAQTWQPGHSLSSDLTSLCLQTRLASEQLHHWRRQVSGPEHGDCGGGLHVQVSHHKMCLHYTWASQFWEPGESTAFNSSVAKSLGLSFTFGEKANLN